MKTTEILEKIERLNQYTKVSLKKIDFSDCRPWYYDDASGEIRNTDRSFFQITGIRQFEKGREISQQPIIIQDEIGYLGIIRKRIDGVLHYLMQYKIEPGNLNKIQISPTIQATKSNFTQKHGGSKPKYLDYFINSHKYRIIADQLQSEQSSRFLGKRNRNIIIELPEKENIEVFNSHDWMTLDQIKELMRIDNLVNMDTRTVLSCIPGYDFEKTDFSDEALRNSFFKSCDFSVLTEIYHYINNYKMFNDKDNRVVPLFSLENWSMKNGEFICSDPYSFKLIFCNIEIEGREVRRWTQPLFEASGAALFGLFTCVENGVRKFLVRCLPEIGAFDDIEIGPSVQREFISSDDKNRVDRLFDLELYNKKNVRFDTMLSEEGGRFYCEQNRNVIIEIDKRELEDLPEGYFWCDYATLNTLVFFNNTLNIQLRNLLSVLEL